MIFPFIQNFFLNFDAWLDGFSVIHAIGEIFFVWVPDNWLPAITLMLITTVIVSLVHIIIDLL